MARKETPAKRLHALARKHGLSLSEFSPGLRVWTIRPASDPWRGEPLAFGVPHGKVAEEILKHSRA